MVSAGKLVGDLGNYLFTLGVIFMDIFLKNKIGLYIELKLVFSDSLSSFINPMGEVRRKI